MSVFCGAALVLVVSRCAFPSRATFSAFSNEALPWAVRLVLALETLGMTPPPPPCPLGSHPRPRQQQEAVAAEEPAPAVRDSRRKAAAGGSGQEAAPAAAGSDGGSRTSRKRQTGGGVHSRRQLRWQQEQHAQPSCPGRLAEGSDVFFFSRLQAATYNVNGRPPPDGLDLSPWLGAGRYADIVAVGFQVCGWPTCSGTSKVPASC
jgi:hypothetical protein